MLKPTQKEKWSLFIRSLYVSIPLRCLSEYRVQMHVILNEFFKEDGDCVFKSRTIFHLMMQYLRFEV